MKKFIRNFLCLMLVLCTVTSTLASCGLLFDSDFGVSRQKVLEEAEDHVNRSVYKDLGVVAEYFDSEIIYEEDGEYLVSVYYGLLDREWDGCYCVYMKGEVVANCTNMLPVGFDFDGRLNELQALFGM